MQGAPAPIRLRHHRPEYEKQQATMARTALTPTRTPPPQPAAPRPRITAAQRRRLRLRDELWPDVTPDQLWSRTRFVGFTTIPRTLPLIIKIIDELDKKKAGRVYFDLWARAFDDYVVEVRDEYEAAFSSGYERQRAVRSWRERIDVLEQYGFVRTKATPHGAYRYVLILDPHKIINTLEDAGAVAEENSLALKALLISIGAVR
jgi:hypothetical protein